MLLLFRGVCACFMCVVFCYVCAFCDVCVVCVVCVVLYVCVCVVVCVCVAVVCCCVKDVVVVLVFVFFLGGCEFCLLWCFVFNFLLN